MNGIEQRLHILECMKIDESKPAALEKEKELVSELLKGNDAAKEENWQKLSKWAEKFNLSKPEEHEVEVKKQSGGCYVATAVYGSYDCPEVWTLRRYRDYTLAETVFGRLFISFYYAISPTLVRWFGETQWFRNLWKPTLDKIVERLNREGVADTPYQDRHW